MTTLVVLVLAVTAIVCLYFIPAWLAYKRGIDSRFVVLIVNIFFGFTVIGWFFLLAIAACAPANKGYRS